MIIRILVMRVLFRLLIICVFTSAIISCGGGGDSSPVNDPVDSSNNNSKLQIINTNIRIGETDEYITGTVNLTERSESLGIIGNIDSNGEPSSITRLLYTAENGDSLEYRIGNNGLPIKITASDGSRIEFNNYISESVDISVFGQNGELIIGPITEPLDNKIFSQIQTLYPFSKSSLKTNFKSGSGSRAKSNSFILSNTDILSLSNGSTLVSVFSCIKVLAPQLRAAISTRGLSLLLNSPNLAIPCGSAFLSVKALITGDMGDIILSEQVDLILCFNSKISNCISSLLNYLSHEYDFASRAPQGLTPDPDDKQIDLSWNKVVDATEYILYFSRNKDVTSNQMTEIYRGPHNNYLHSNLLNLEAYYYVVQAVNSDNELTNFSDKIAAFPHFKLPAPDEAKGIPGVEKITVTWRKVDKAEDYFVYYGKQSGQGTRYKLDYVVCPSTIFVIHTCTIPNLEPGVPYYFTVEATGDYGSKSGLSVEASAIPLAPAPPAPPVPPEPVNNLIAIAVDGVIKLFWYPASNIEKYRVYWGESQGQGNKSEFMSEELTDINFILTEPKLKLDTTYYFTVVEIKNDLESELSEEVDAIVESPPAPSAPNDVQVIPGNGEVTVSWAPVTDADSYAVYWGATAGQGPEISQIWLNNVSSPLVVPNLTNGITYYFTVTASRGLKESGASVERNATPTTSIVVVPPEPTPSFVLNDTGITWSTYSSGNCDGENISQQDCSHGRDATFNDDSDGHAGFSFTKLDYKGKQLSGDANEWACLRDNVTGLTWQAKKTIVTCNPAVGALSSERTCVQDSVTGSSREVSNSHLVCNGSQNTQPNMSVKCFGAEYPGEGVDGYLVYDERLHNSYDTFNWYNTDSVTNGGSVGYADDDGDVCFGYDINDPATYCNTQSYAARVNSTSLCGVNKWRMPSRMELIGIVNLNRYDPAIDTVFFPNTQSRNYWTSKPYAGNSVYSWQVDFRKGNTEYYSVDGRSDRNAVRLLSD